VQFIKFTRKNDVGVDNWVKTLREVYRKATDAWAGFESLAAWWLMDKPKHAFRLSTYWHRYRIILLGDTGTSGRISTRQRQLNITIQYCITIQEAQLMLTNLRDAFIGQSRSPNIAPFHTLGIVSYCAIVTLSSLTICGDACPLHASVLRPASQVGPMRDNFVFIRLQKLSWPWNRARGHSKSLKVAPFDRLCMVSY